MNMVLSIVLTLLPPGELASDAKEVRWWTDLPAAQAHATETRKPLLVMFT